MKRLLRIFGIATPRPNTQGYYPTEYTRGGELVCPFCGTVNFTVQGEHRVTCVHHHAFEFHGVLGLKQII